MMIAILLFVLAYSYSRMGFQEGFDDMGTQTEPPAAEPESKPTTTLEQAIGEKPMPMEASSPSLTLAPSLSSASSLLSQPPVSITNNNTITGFRDGSGGGGGGHHGGDGGHHGGGGGHHGGGGHYSRPSTYGHNTWGGGGHRLESSYYVWPWWNRNYWYDDYYYPRRSTYETVYVETPKETGFTGLQMVIAGLLGATAIGAVMTLSK